SPAIGVACRCTNCVSVFKNGRVEIIANDQGNRITPSYVAFTSEGERLIGDAAKNQLTSNPENTVFDAKRLIGRTWGDSSVQQDIKYLPFKVILCSLCWPALHPHSPHHTSSMATHTWSGQVD
uniref:Heat shock protein 70 n=1 Tax=Acanthochromis polyacanthus TaxID=80966 RepID=A0A3Q1GHZ1_9TELE